MTRLEAKITALLAEVFPLINLREEFYEKWIETSKTEAETRRFRNNNASISTSFHISLPDIQKIDEYKDAKLAFESDPVYGSAEDTAGYWGRFDTILVTIVTKASSIQKREISIDINSAIDYLMELRNLFMQDALTYTATLRVVGVELKCKSIKLPETVILSKLNRKERNERAPHIGMFSSWEDSNLSRQKTEAKATITVPIDSKKGSHFSAINNATLLFKELFENIQNAILLAFPGYCEFSPVKITGGIPGMMHGTNLFKACRSIRLLNWVKAIVIFLRYHTTL